MLLLTSLSHALDSIFFFLMIRRPPRSTLDRSSAASDVYKRQPIDIVKVFHYNHTKLANQFNIQSREDYIYDNNFDFSVNLKNSKNAVSYTHLRAHETVLDLVCRLLLEKKK